MMNNLQLIDKLHKERTLTGDEWTTLIGTHTPEEREYARSLAQSIAVENFGRNIYFRGIVEFSNYCKNNCYYCGIRTGNTKVSRYRLTDDDILRCCEEGYGCGFRTFVLQGGEDPVFTDERFVNLIRRIKEAYPDCAVTLSIGERSRESYQKLREAGADRFLLRHETADPHHYSLLHPANLTLENRIRCLRDLKSLWFQTGCGMMIGSPYQTAAHIAKDMVFMGEFKPQMIGVGPFLPHSDTPFRDQPAGSVDLTLFLISLCRIMLPKVLLPSTTALGTAQSDGRKLGVLAGCNVVMPNLSPADVRKKYMLYNNKSGTDLTAAQGIEMLTGQMKEIGYNVIVGRGDFQTE